MPASRGPMSLEIAGSHHGWSGEDGTRLDLSLAVDDATSTMPRQAARRLGRPDARAVIHWRRTINRPPESTANGCHNLILRARLCAHAPGNIIAAARQQAAARTQPSASAAITRSSRSNRGPRGLRAQARAHAGARGGRGLNYRLGADSSVGSAPHSHCGGRGFESHSVHHDVLNCELRRLRRPQRCPERQSQQKPGVRFPTGPTQHPTGVTRHARK